MLGLLAVVGVVMAYELDVIECGPATGESDCEVPIAHVEVERECDPVTAGRRPHPSSRADALAQADKLALLETQNALLAERNVTGELAYYNLGQLELEAMARHCDVRSDYPKNIAPQEAKDLGLDASEREAWTRALQNFADQELERYRSLLAEIEPETPTLETMTLAQVRRRLVKVAGKTRTAADESLRRHVAEERAGLREPPDPVTLSPWNRYNRLRFNAGDRFAALLGDELGDDRAHELRSVFEGWPGARTRQWGCPDEPMD